MEEIEHIIRYPQNQTHTTPILLQHGAWHGAWCWEYWLDYLAFLGYEVHMINLPGRGKSSLNKGHINLYTLGDYVNILANEVGRISPTPVVVGHSMGGGILQKYLEKHQLPGAVMVAAIPACGAWGMMLRLTIRHPITTIKSFLTMNMYCFVETPALARELFLSADAEIDVVKFQQQLVSDSVAAGMQVVFPFAKVNEAATPIMVLASGKDRFSTLEEQKTTVKKYKSKMIVFEEQAHDLMLERGWRKAADTVDEWITQELNLP
jgi:alpha-beta hydrolase superfamily lysophospholipase